MIMDNKISRRSALNYLNEYNLIVEAGRNGSEAFRNKISMQPRRKRPSEALSFWSIDGWTVELYYQKEVRTPDGKVVHTYMNRLTAVVVLDATCDFPVGYAIGECESVKLIAAAVKNAIDYVHDTLGGPFRPYQIQSDHYGIKSMGTIYRDVAEYFTPARVKNPKTKPVEPYFRYLNTEYCQKEFGNSNWSGFGVRTRQKRQPNIDVLDMIAVTAPLTGCCIRTANLMNSEIIGKPTDVPWAFVFERVDLVARHPAQLYEALAYLLFFVIMVIIYRRHRYHLHRGFYLGLCLTEVFVFRFLIEFLKENQVGFEEQMTLNMGQWLSVPFVLGCETYEPVSKEELPQEVRSAIASRYVAYAISSVFRDHEDNYKVILKSQSSKMIAFYSADGEYLKQEIVKPVQIVALN